MSRLSSAWEALQERLNQDVETVTRASRVDVVGGGIDEINPPEELDEFAEQARTTGPVRKNIRQFVNDVWEPGYKVQAESEATRDYFVGGENAPENTPEDGFLSQAAVYAGQRHEDFYPFGKETTWQKWVRGTATIELLKNDPSDPESVISGFHFIRPETLYPQVQNNTNILLPPEVDELPEDIAEKDVTKTQRDEVAAYIQFDDESILGLRGKFSDQNEVPLSQNDVMKQTLEADIGDDFGTETQGVFGTSIIEGIAEDIAEYKQIKRDRAEAIETKAYGIWDAEFGREVLEYGNTTEVIEWSDSDMQAYRDELENLEPGEVAVHDGSINFDKFDSTVPDLVETINQYISIILAPLPAPKYMVGFAEGINRDVSEEQKEAYDDLVSEERRYQERKWSEVLRIVAERQGLDTEGLKLKIEPEVEENPVKSLETAEVDRMNTYVKTLATAAGPQAGPTALVDSQELLEVLDFPVEEATPEDVIDDVATEDTEAAWQDIMGLESLESFSDGEVVDTPDGLGIIDDVITDGTVDGKEGSEDAPVYAVVVEDESVGVGFYRDADLSSGSVDDLPGPEDATAELEAMADIHSATDTEALQDGFFEWPESWEDSETPARVIGLKAWAGMNGSFDGCVREMRGNLAGSPDRFCADFKDRLYMREDWRGGWESMARGSDPFENIPVVPSGLDTLTKPWLIRWAEWVAAGKPQIPKSEALEWNPALHPRDPETGKFVERPFNVPDDMPDFSDSSSGEVLQFLSDEGEDIDAILNPEGGITIDGVPNDATSIEDISDTTALETSSVTNVPESREVVEAPLSKGGLREFPENATPDELAQNIPTIDERFGDELEGVPVSPSNDLSSEDEAAMRETIARVMGNIKDGGMLEKYYKRISHIHGRSNDESGSEGHAGISQNIPGEGNEMANMHVTNPGIGTRTVIHEQAHNIHQTMGYSSGGFSAGSSGGFQDYTLPDGDGRNILDGLQKHENEDAPPVAGEDVATLFESVSVNDGRPERRSNGEIVSALDEEISGSEDEKYRRYMAEINRAFVKTQGVRNREGNTAAASMVKRPYGMTNANEFTAVVEESFQNGDKMAIRKYVEHHPELVNAYTELYDIPENAQEVLDFKRSAAE